MSTPKFNPLTVPGSAFGAPVTTDPKVEQTTHEFQGTPGTVISVNGHFGVVTLTAADVGADVAGAAAAAQAASQPLNMNLTQIAALATQAYGRGVLTAANAGALRAYLGLGSAALSNTGDFDAAGQAAAAYAAAIAYVTALTWVQTIQPGTNVSVDSTDPRNPIVSATGSTPALAHGQIFVGNGSNVAVSVAMTGDIGITDTGVTTIKTSVNLTGTPTTATQAQGDDSSALATTEYVDIGLAATLTDAQTYLNAHGIFNNLGVPGYILVADSSGIAAAVPMTGDVTIDDVGVTTIRSSIALPGNPTTTTQSPGNNSTRVATTAYVDTAIGGAPTGAMFEYAGTGAPSGWLFCDGSAVSRTTYAALFAVIGVAFGAGDGSTTFNLPDRRDRFGLGASGTHALGSTGGATTHDHTSPAHDHPLSANGYSQIAPAGAGGPVMFLSRINVVPWVDNIQAAITGLAAATGGVSRTVGAALAGLTDSRTPANTGAATGPIDPYVAINVIIKV